MTKPGERISEIRERKTPENHGGRPMPLMETIRKFSRGIQMSALAVFATTTMEGCGWKWGVEPAPTPPAPVAVRVEVPPQAATDALNTGIGNVGQAFNDSSVWARNAITNQLNCNPGSPCAYQVQHATDQANNAALVTQAGALNAQITYRETQINLLQQEIIRKNGEIALLNQEIRHLQEKLAECECEKRPCTQAQSEQRERIVIQIREKTAKRTVLETGRETDATELAAHKMLWIPAVPVATRATETGLPDPVAGSALNPCANTPAGQTCVE